MISIANEYRRDNKVCSTDVKHRVFFETCDLDEIVFKQSYYDLIICRDVLMHYENKSWILRRLKGALRPGGRILLTDYCRMEKDFDDYTQEFIDYADEWDYFLITIEDQKEVLEKAGFGMASLLSNPNCCLFRNRYVTSRNVLSWIG